MQNRNALRRRLPTCLALCIMSLLMPAIVAAQNCENNEQRCNGRCIPVTSLCILEPVPGGTDEIPSGGVGLSAFYMYVNNGVWQWIFGIGVAVAVLNGTIGGLQIVLSNGDSGKIGEGKTRFISSAIGLLVLLLAGVILAFLNPIGFTSS